MDNRWLFRLPNGTELRLGPGKHSALQRAVLDQFRPRFAAGSHALYLADAHDRPLYADEVCLSRLHIDLDGAGSLPDVLLFDEGRQWLFLIQAAHTKGALSASRVIDLKTSFQKCPLPLVFVTAIFNRQTLRVSKDMAWDTVVWVADEPDHMIHFGGDRFLGPRETMRDATANALCPV